MCVTPAFAGISVRESDRWRRIRRELVGKANLRFSLDGAQTRPFEISYYKDPWFEPFENEVRSIPVGHDGVLKITVSMVIGKLHLKNPLF